MAICDTCGKQNNDAAKFCTSCGNKLKVYDQAAPPASSTSESTVTSEKDDYPKAVKEMPNSSAFDSATRKKLIVAALLILTTLGVVGYFVWYKPYLKDKNATRMYSFANSLALRSSPSSGGNYNMLTNLLYGSEILVYELTGEWASGKADDKIGFVSAQFLLDKKEFQELNGILADADTRDAISTTKCRKALLTYFNDKGIMGKINPEIQKELYKTVQQKEVWQVFTKAKNSSLNNVAYPRVVNPNSKYTDFACIIKNTATYQRKFLLFSFSDDEKAILQSEQDAPLEGYIKSISPHSYYVEYAY